ncbi:MAG: hypothetical protein M3Q97_01930 [Bacteroidota bacterium]|nr:hypothetical protein [Bacteroidota bacterium]
MCERSEQFFQLVIVENRQFVIECVRIPLEVKGVHHLVVQQYYEVRKGWGHRDDGGRVRMDEPHKSFATGIKLFPLLRVAILI